MPRLPIRLFVVAAVLAGGATLVAAPAWAATVEIDPPTAPPGGYVRVDLAGAAAYAAVDVTLDGAALVTLRADEPGTLATCVQLPYGTAPGEHELSFAPAGDDAVTVPVTVAEDADGATGCLEGPPGGDDGGGPGDETGSDDGADSGAESGADSGDGLPDTGAAPLAVLAAGAGLVLAGAAVHRSTRSARARSVRSGWAAGGRGRRAGHDAGS